MHSHAVHLPLGALLSRSVHRVWAQVAFNPQGNKIITASSDRSCRVWDVESGDCLQVLEGHTDEIFSAAFNYEGDTIITGSKDNTCRIWKC